MVRRLLPGVLACAIAFASFGYRFLSLELTDDDYLQFAIGRQVQQFGDWPVRDLIEEGDPLQNVTSAVLQGVFGYRLAPEVFFDLAMLSIAAALAFLIGHTISGSLFSSVAVTVLAVLMAPRPYGYSKTVIPMLGLWCCVSYIRRPSWFRAAAAGVITGIGFLFRHDLGVYLAAAVLVTVGAMKIAGSVLPRSRVYAYAGAAALGVVPYLVYVELNGGLLAYVTASRSFVQREVGRSDDAKPSFVFDLSRPFWERSPGFPVKIRWAPTVDDPWRVELERRYQLTDGSQDEGRTWNYMLHDLRQKNVRAIVAEPAIEDTANIDRADPAVTGNSVVERLRRALRAPPVVALAPGVFSRNNGVTWLYYLFMALPYAVLVSLLIPVVRQRHPLPSWVSLAPVIALSAMAGPFWLRGNLYANFRLADLAFPSAVLGAWLLAASMRPARMAVRTTVLVLTTVVYVTTATSVAAFANLRRGVDDAIVAIDRVALSDEVGRRMAWLLETPPPLSLLSKDTGVRGAAEYLRHCTAPGDRVFLYGFYPEVQFFSGRASAAGRSFVARGFWAQEAEQRHTIAAMRKGPTPVALIDVETAGPASPGRFLDPSLGILDAYLAQHYREAGTTGFGSSGNLTFRVLVDRQRTPTGTYAPLSLPCFA